MSIPSESGAPADDRAVEHAAVVDLETEDWQQRQRFLRRLSWGTAWVLPLLALIVGIALTANGTIAQEIPSGGGFVDVTFLTVWPAGLTLLGSGLLGTVAVAIATAVLAEKRAASGPPAS